MCEVLHTVTQDVGMARLPVSGTEFHDGDESAEVVNFDLWVVAMDQSRQVEQLGTLHRREAGGERRRESERGRGGREG